MSSSAAAVVAALARSHAQLTGLAASLRQVPGVAAVSSAMTPRRYAEDRIECYVDARLQNGNTVGMWLEFRWDNGSWVVESSIRHNTDAGEDELVCLPDAPLVVRRSDGTVFAWGSNTGASSATASCSKRSTTASL